MTSPPASPLRRALVGSCVLHGVGLTLVVLGLWRRSVRTSPAPLWVLRPSAVVTFEAPPPPPPAPPSPASLPSSPSLAAAPRVAAVVPRARVVRAVLTATTANAETGEITTTPTPPPTAPGPEVPGRLSLRATELLGAGRSAVPSLAVESLIAEQSPEVQRARLRAIAAGPTQALLAESQNRLPAGTMTHDRAVARRAQEMLDVQRAVPDLHARLAASPVFTMGAIARTAVGLEVAAGSELDQAHQQSYVTEQMPPGYAPCQSYRIVRVEIELTHDTTGVVTDARVTDSSGAAALDAMAVEALRGGHGEVEAAQGGVAARTRWQVEVSPDRDAYVPIACGATGGWTVWAPRNGARFGVRVRVRRLRNGA